MKRMKEWMGGQPYWHYTRLKNSPPSMDTGMYKHTWSNYLCEKSRNQVRDSYTGVNEKTATSTRVGKGEIRLSKPSISAQCPMIRRNSQISASSRGVKGLDPTFRAPKGHAPKTATTESQWGCIHETRKTAEQTKEQLLPGMQALTMATPSRAQRRWKRQNRPFPSFSSKGSICILWKLLPEGQVCNLAHI